MKTVFLAAACKADYDNMSCSLASAWKAKKIKNNIENIENILKIILFSGAIGPRSGPGTGKKASYGSGKQTLRLKANGTAAIEEVDNSRTLAEDNINKLLETFMGINDSELGK